MGLKRQIKLVTERRKNDFPGMTAGNVEQVLEQWSLSDDAAPLYTGPGTSVQAPGASASGGRSFMRIAMIEDVAVFNAAGQLTLATPLPIGAVPMSAHLNFDTPLVYAGGATKISFGIAGTLNQLAASASAVVAKNTKTDASLVSVVESVTAVSPLLVTATNDAFAATGTVTGTVRCRVIYRYYSASIGNAA